MVNGLCFSVTPSSLLIACQIHPFSHWWQRLPFQEQIGCQSLAEGHFDMQLRGGKIRTINLPITIRPTLPPEQQPPCNGHWTMKTATPVILRRYDFCYVLTEKLWEAEMTNCAFKPRSTYYFSPLVSQPTSHSLYHRMGCFQLPSCDRCMELIVTTHPTSKPFLNNVNWTNSIQHCTPWDVNECSRNKEESGPWGKM